MVKLNIVVLAAGQGKRMNSDLPKVLQPISAVPMLQHVLQTSLQLNPDKIIIVYGHGASQIQTVINNAFVNNNFIWALQERQLGTGHALKCALSYLDPDGITLVLYGDVPLISQNTLLSLLKRYNSNIVMLIDKLHNPTGYGRIVRNNDKQIVGIVEEKDASSQQKLICEISTGFYLIPNKPLANWLNSLSNENSQGEYYLTDIIALAYRDKVLIDYIEPFKHYEVLGINNKTQLEQVERFYQLAKAEQLLIDGVTLIDKSRIDIRGDFSAGKDCTIDINCIFEGKVVLGNRVKIEAGCILKDVFVADDVEIKAYSNLDGVTVANNVKVGPYARLRPGTTLAANSHIGNFVEVKNSNIGSGSKVNHLTYIGDSDMGAKVNVGAGSVTCNYDGYNKYRTTIEDNVFIGSGTMMVAPVTISYGSIIGAGSVITKDTKAKELTVSRAKQVTVFGWLERNKKEF